MPGPFSASVSTVTVDKTTVVADGVDAVTVTVTVKDAQGNPIAGSTVTIESTGTLNTITQPVGLTLADGVAVGTVKSTKAEGKTITAKVGGVEALTKTRNVTFTAGPFSAAVSTVTVDKTTVVADGVDAVTVTATVKDAQGNPIAGSSVTIESTGTSNTITQPVGLTVSRRSGRWDGEIDEGGGEDDHGEGGWGGRSHEDEERDVHGRGVQCGGLDGDGGQDVGDGGRGRCDHGDGDGEGRAGESDSGELGDDRVERGLRILSRSRWG